MARPKSTRKSAIAAMERIRQVLALKPKSRTATGATKQVSTPKRAARVTALKRRTVTKKVTSKAPKRSISRTPKRSVSRAPKKSVTRTPKRSVSRAPKRSGSRVSVSRKVLKSVKGGSAITTTKIQRVTVTSKPGLKSRTVSNKTVSATARKSGSLRTPATRKSGSRTQVTRKSGSRTQVTRKRKNGTPVARKSSSRIKTVRKSRDKTSTVKRAIGRPRKVIADPSPTDVSSRRPSASSGSSKTDTEPTPIEVDPQQ